MTNKTICRDDGRCEYAIQAGIEGLAQCQAGKCSMPQPAHLTIPGALEWDGDNGTHGADGESRISVESSYDDANEACAEVERTGSPGDVIREMNDELVDLRAQLDDYKSKWLANFESLKLLGIHARHAEKLVKSCREKLEVDSAGKGFIEALDGFISALSRDDNTHSADGDNKAAVVCQPNYERMFNAAVMSLVVVGEAVGVRGEDQLNGSIEIVEAIEKIKGRREKAQAEVEDLRARLANTEQSRRSFFDLSQDLEKRLAERDALLSKCKSWIEAARDGVLYPVANDFQGVVGHNAEGLGQQSVELLDSLSNCEESRNIIELSDGPLIDEGTKAACSRCGDWGHIETEDSAYDCPECGPSVVERSVEAGVMNAPKLYAADDIPDFTPGSGNKARRRIEAMEKAKQKTCIECDQPYCHGVCVERGDQDYDRDQAAKGGDQ